MLHGENEIVIASPEKALWDKLYLHLRGNRFSMDWLRELRLQNLEEFELSKWRDFTSLAPSKSLRRASAKMAEYIQEARR